MSRVCAKNCIGQWCHGFGWNPVILHISMWSVSIFNLQAFQERPVPVWYDDRSKQLDLHVCTISAVAIPIPNVYRFGTQE